MLCEVDLGEALDGAAFGVLVEMVVFGSVDEHDDVSVLLDGTRLAEVAELGFLGAAAGFDGAAELRECEDGKRKFFGECLELTRDGADFLLAVAGSGHLAACLHELQVVDDHHREVGMLLFETTAFGAELEDGELRSVVDEKRSIVEGFDTGGHDLAFAIGEEVTFLEAASGDLGGAGNEAHGEVNTRHLEREDSYRLVEIDSNVLGDAEREGGFTHTRASGQDDEGARLETGGDAVEGGEARLLAADAAFFFLEFLDLLHGIGDQRADRLVVGAEVLVVDVHEFLLGGVEEPNDIGGFVVGLGDGLCGGAYELALDVFFAKDAGVVLDVGAAYDVVGKLSDTVGAASQLEGAVFAETLDDGLKVNRIRVAEEFEDGIKNILMLRLVEILTVKGLDGVVEGVAVEHKGTQNSLLDFESLGRCLAIEVEHRVVIHSFLIPYTGSR